MLRGAKSLADKIDVGQLMLPVNKKDLESLQIVLAQNAFETPNMKISIYKNRRGRYNAIYLWCKAELGVCRINPLFATTWAYEFVPIDDTIINVTERSAF